MSPAVAAVRAACAGLGDPRRWAGCYDLLTSAKLEFAGAAEEDRPGILAGIEALVPAAHAGRVFLLSFLVALDKNPRYARLLLDAVCEATFPPATMSFLYAQLAALAFRNHGLFGVEDEARLAGYYAAIFGRRRAEAPSEHDWIAPGRRNPNRVLVACGTFLDMAHSPTRWTANICKTLQRDFGKEILLINTAELPRSVLPTAFFDPFVVRFEEAYSGVRTMKYGGTDLAFRQFNGPLGSAAELAALARVVAEFNPAFVLNIGGPLLGLELCSRFTSVVTLPLTCRFPTAVCTLYAVRHGLSEADRAIARVLGVTEEMIIHTGTAEDLPPRTRTLARSDLGLPGDAYVLAIAGNRLDSEVTPEFGAALEKLLERAPRTFVAFIGMFKGYAKIAAAHSALKPRSRLLGFQQDLRAAYAACDAYLNPPRQGGGASAVLAMAEGLPVLTLAEGDVASMAGPRFQYACWGDIMDEVARCAGDRSYQAGRKEVALERCAELTDLKTFTGDLLAQAEARLRAREEPA